MGVPRFLKNAFTGYEIIEMKEFLKDGKIEIWLRATSEKDWKCMRCGEQLGASRDNGLLTLTFTAPTLEEAEQQALERVGSILP